MTNGDLSTAPKDVDLLIVGCGLSGAVIAERCSKELGMKSLILDVRDHIGGNCYDFVEEHGLRASQYGAHLVSASARRKLARDGYLPLKSIFPREVQRFVQNFYRKLRNDPTGHGAYWQRKSKRFEFLPELVSTYLNVALTPMVSALVGRQVAPTYPFPIFYEPGGSIHPHVDVSDNEVSLSYQAEFLGKSDGGWPLWFLDAEGQSLEGLEASRSSSVVLRDNEGVLYFGPRVVHWREPRSYRLSQLVFAWRTFNVSHCAGQ